MSAYGKLALLFSGFSLIISAGTRFILGGWTVVLYIFLALFILGILASLVLDYKFYLEILTAKTAKNSLSLGWSLLLVVVLLSSAGYFGRRFNRTFDFTEEKINSLALQSEEALESLTEDLTVYIFYKGDKISERGRSVKEELKNSFTLYKQKSAKFKTRFKDAYKNPALAEKFRLSDLPDKNREEVFVFAEYLGRQARITAPFNEQSITSAVIKVKKRTVKEIYFLTGHGEKELSDDRPEGLKIFKQGLTDSGFVFKEWSFVQSGAPPKDPVVLLIAGPRRPFLPEELKWIKGYLERGGRIFMALDPGEKHNLKPFLKEYGVDYQDNFILIAQDSPFGRIVTEQALAVSFDADHAVTRRLSTLKNTPAVFNRASVVAVRDDEGGGGEKWDISRLVRTVSYSFAVPKLTEKVKPGPLSALTVAVEVKPKKEEEEPASLSDPHEGHDSHGHDSSEEKAEKSTSPDGGKDTQNKKDSSDEKGFRLLVFGDSDFLTNRNIYNGVNRDLALNAVISLVDEEDLITIRPKRAKGTEISLTGNHRMGLVLLMVILPLIFLFLSLWLWYKRREA